MGIASRREAERWIQAGRVSVNGNVVTELGTKINPLVDELAIDGNPVEREAPPLVYWMLHKPDLCLTSHKGDGDKATVFDLPSLNSLPFKLNAVGRLDYRTEGLLLLSNDGEFVHHLTHPKYKVPRHYYALVNKKLSAQQIAEIQKGVSLEDGKTGPIEIQHAQTMKLGKTTGNWYYLTVHEGRNRLIRRLFEHFDLKVVRLIRFGFGHMRLPDDLKPGEYVQLSSEDIAKLKKASKMI